MGAKLSFKYDRDADILHIDKRSPYPEQDRRSWATRSSRVSIPIRARFRRRVRWIGPNWANLDDFL